jgi:hypothetical protein
MQQQQQQQQQQQLAGLERAERMAQGLAKLGRVMQPQLDELGIWIG